MRITVSCGDWNIILEFCILSFGAGSSFFLVVASSSKRTVFCCCCLLDFFLFGEDFGFGTVPVEM